MGDKGNKKARGGPGISAVPTAWEDPCGSWGRGSAGTWGTLGRKGDTACTPAWLILTWKEQVVDEEGKDIEMNFEQVVGKAESCRGMRKDDFSLRVAAAFNLTWLWATPGMLGW